MTKVLCLDASPKGALSASSNAATIALDALPNGCEIDRVNLFETPLPEVTIDIATAKMKNVMGVPLTDEEARQWADVTKLVAQFLAADYYIFGVPMWNFSIPYKLKHYIDAINHPGLTFTRDDNGPRGLASGKALLIYSRGGDYSAKDGAPDPLDFQSTYMKSWLGSTGITDVTEVLVQNTLAGPEGAANAVAGAKAELEAFAQSVAIA